MNRLPPDFLDLLTGLNAAEAKYLLVGGHDRLETKTRRMAQRIERLVRKENIAHDGVDRACHRDDRLPLGFERDPHWFEPGVHWFERGVHRFE